VTDRPRLVNLSWAGACLGLFVLLAALVHAEWSPLRDLDRALSKPLADAVENRDGLGRALHVLELATGTLGTTVLVLVIFGLLWAKGHTRAATYCLGVVALAIPLAHLVKYLVDVDRPVWQNPLGGLDNAAYPSGHATYAAALAGVLMVVVLMLVRRAGIRRLLCVALALWVVVIGLDRLLLGRHVVSDLVGGVLLAAALVLGVLAFWSPLPRGHAASAAPLVETVPSASRDLHVVLNPIKVEDVGQFQSIVSAMARESGWNEPVWHLTSVEDPGTGQAHEASVAGADLVLVCGGDGTVREVCAELAGTGIPVGIVPAGTGNLLGRNLDLPLYFRSAIDVALNGQDRAIDMVRISGDGIEDTSFLVMAGMGFDAAIMEGVNEDLKKKVGWVAYVLSALKALMFPAMRLEVSVDDGPFTRHRARTVVIGNVGNLQAGMPLIPNAEIDDGKLDVVLLHPKRFLSWLPLAFRVLAKRKRTDETIERFTGHKVVVRASQDVPRQIDGDIIGAGTELVCENVHGRLLVRVPR
jgi:YegS/Rv2252/BmrU family lipid kinase